MVKLQNIRNSTESFLEVGDLLESVPELYHRGLIEHAILAHNEFAVLERVQIRRN